MATISSELDRIKQAKSDLRAVIESKGVPVDPMATIDKYPSFVENIQTGGSIVLQNKTVTTNGTVTADSGYDGLGTVTVNVSPNLTTLNATQNGTYTPTSPVQGYSSVVVNVGQVPEYFYLEDLSGGDITMTITYSSGPVFDVYCSEDQTTWTNLGTNDSGITATVKADSKLYLKASTTAWGVGANASGTTINCDDKFGAGGNIMSLLNGDNFNGSTFTTSNEYAFSYLFYNSNIIDAEDLVLPQNTVKECYARMFQNSTNLTSAPVLPAYYVAPQAYHSMFANCSALTTAPDLPATEIGNESYFAMFENCTALTSTPVLPDTGSYGSPYFYMFTGCSSLVRVISYIKGDYSNGFAADWLNNVNPTGDFYNLGQATFSTDSSGIPSGWTEHNSI